MEVWFVDDIVDEFGEILWISFERVFYMGCAQEYWEQD